MTDMLANLPEQVYFLDPAKYASYFVRNADGTINYINNTTMNLAARKRPVWTYRLRMPSLKRRTAISRYRSTAPT
jgi:hypothetical protein